MEKSNIIKNENFTIENIVCVICGHAFTKEKLVTVKRGFDTILSIAEIKGDSVVIERCKHAESCHVHETCRRSYTDKRTFTEFQNGPSTPIIQKKLRSSMDSDFQWTSKCLYCGKEADSDTKHPGRSSKKVVNVASAEFRNSLEKMCSDPNHC